MFEIEREGALASLRSVVVLAQAVGWQKSIPYNANVPWKQDECLAAYAQITFELWLITWGKGVRDA